MCPMATNVSSVDTTYRKVFVGGLPYHTSDESLREFFNSFGDIEEAVVIHDRATGKSKGYGFVTMQDADAANKAVANPTPIIDGRKANVNLAYLGAKPRPKLISGVGCLGGLRPLTTQGLLHPQYTATTITPQYIAAYQNYCQALAAHQHALVAATLQPQTQAQPAAQTYFDHPYYAAAAAAQLQYTAPTSPEYTTTQSAAAQYAGLSPPSTSTAAYLAAAQHQPLNGFMQVTAAAAANQYANHSFPTYSNESQ